tara:strand:- start:664 stop:1398 length:735 start_codon:yes stop_codon:yes gene_type:complete
MDVLIVDDESLARDRMSRMIAKIDGYEVVSTVGNSKDALAAIRVKDPEVVLLDVRMPGDDGLACARRIAELDDPPAVIFCTAYDEYALDAFSTEAVGYLVKPVKLEQLQQALEKSRRLNKVQRLAMSECEPAAEQRSQISAKTLRGLEIIALEDVRCFIADQKYVTAYHVGGETLIDDTLKELESEFVARMVRIHRNALVSLRHIEGLQRRTDGYFEVVLEGVALRPLVSRRHASKLRELLGHL